MARLCSIVIFLLIFSFAQSQTTLSFCASVEHDGYCAFYNTKFITSPDSATGRIYMLVRNPAGIGLPRLTYEVYQLDKDGKEKLENTIVQTIEPQWVYAWQYSFFKTPGKYKIRVVNDAGEFICGKSFELFNVW